MTSDPRAAGYPGAPAIYGELSLGHVPPMAPGRLALVRPGLAHGVVSVRLPAAGGRCSGRRLRLRRRARALGGVAGCQGAGVMILLEILRGLAETVRETLLPSTTDEGGPGSQASSTPSCCTGSCSFAVTYAHCRASGTPLRCRPSRTSATSMVASIGAATGARTACRRSPIVAPRHDDGRVARR